MRTQDKYLSVQHCHTRSNTVSSDTQNLGEMETLMNVLQKMLGIFSKSKITPILCVGERERDEAHTYFAFIENQLSLALLGILKKILRA